MISLVTVSHLPEGSDLYSNFKRAWGRVLRSTLEVRITARVEQLLPRHVFVFKHTDFHLELRNAH